MKLIFEPVFDYGRTQAEWTLTGDDRHTADATGAGQTIRLRTDMLLGIEGNRARARRTLEAGGRLYCCPPWAEDLACAEDMDDAIARLEATRRFWRRWLARGRIPDHRWQYPLQRSALAIKGLTYMATGSTVAALR